jgi:hypothetical protein
MDRTDIADGLAAAAYFHTEDDAIAGNFQPLKLLHLLSLRSHGMPLMPKPMAYIFHRRERANNEALVMVTDMPAVIGAKTGTNLLNGIAPFAWVVRGVRELTDWEYTLIKTLGRNFFYSHLAEETDAAIKSYLAIPEGEYKAKETPGRASVSHGFFPHRAVARLRSTDMRDTILKNVQAARHCGFDREPLEDFFEISETVADLRGNITLQTLRTIIPMIAELADNADYIEDQVNELAHELESLVGNQWHMLESPDMKQTEEMKAFQAGLSDVAKRRNLVGRTKELFSANQTLISDLINLSIDGQINAALINKIAYITRTERYDPGYAASLLSDLLKLLDLAPQSSNLKESIPEESELACA